ncbi:uncharacterized protein CANTADRAFT_42981, partial [Suhomyces tanzawaensis NRRL Y-17324]
PRGILRNKSVSEGHKTPSSQELDRQEVIKNTRLNAQALADSSEGDKIRAQIAAKSDHEQKEGEHLKWDELNLYKTEQEKNSTMKIDEPKTPYEGGFDPNGEYYREDNEEDIPVFELGEGENDGVNGVVGSLNGGEVLKRDDEDYEDEDEEEEAPQLTAEERHHKFEEMRKAHYHMKGKALKNNI